MNAVAVTHSSLKETSHQTISQIMRNPTYRQWRCGNFLLCNNERREKGERVESERGTERRASSEMRGGVEKKWTIDSSSVSTQRDAFRQQRAEKFAPREMEMPCANKTSPKKTARVTMKSQNEGKTPFITCGNKTSLAASCDGPVDDIGDILPARLALYWQNRKSNSEGGKAEGDDEY